MAALHSRTDCLIPKGNTKFVLCVHLGAGDHQNQISWAGICSRPCDIYETMMRGKSRKRQATFPQGVLRYD